MPRWGGQQNQSSLLWATLAKGAGGLGSGMMSTTAIVVSSLKGCSRTPFSLAHSRRTHFSKVDAHFLGSCPCMKASLAITLRFSVSQRPSDARMNRRASPKCVARVCVVWAVLVFTQVWAPLDNTTNNLWVGDECPRRVPITDGPRHTS